jgi:hypothetical protein
MRCFRARTLAEVPAFSLVETARVWRTNTSADCLRSKTRKTLVIRKTSELNIEHCAARPPPVSSTSLMRASDKALTSSADNLPACAASLLGKRIKYCLRLVLRVT